MRAYRNRAVVLMGLSALLGMLILNGCKGKQFAHILKESDRDLVGSHSAGSATFNPLVEQAVGSLLMKQAGFAQQDPQLAIDAQSPVQWGAPTRVCFIGLENRSSEELGDFHDQLHQQIDTLLSDSPNVSQISGRFVDAGLKECRIRPEELFVPENMRRFSASMEQQGQPFDAMIFGTLTSGTTESNADYQRDYLLTLEMVDVRTGQHAKESANVRKGYHKSRLSAAAKYNPFRR